MLRGPRGPGVRPTMDRVRSALFAILDPRTLDGVLVADFFAGTGSLGIEALSRGAGHADFVELDPRESAVIQGNLRVAKLEERGTVHRLPAERAAEVLAGPYDLVFVDPPYSYPFPSLIVACMDSRGMLARGAVVVVGHAARLPSPGACGALRRWQDRVYGDSALAFYCYDSEGSP